MTGKIRVVTHQVRHLDVAADLPFEQLRERYEKRTPFEPGHFFDHRDPDHTDWATVSRITDQQAPHGLLPHWRDDVYPMMRVAGHDRRCTTYLMGNHVIAERTYSHDPASCSAHHFASPSTRITTPRSGSPSTRRAPASPVSATRTLPSSAWA